MSILAIALLAISPVAQAEVENPDTIVVTGQAPTPREIRERALEYVRRTGVAELKPIARWITPICPRVMEVEAHVAAIVEKRIREAAAAAGAPTAPSGCAANVMVVFTSDGGSFARAMLRKSPQRLAGLSTAARERVVKGDDAIRWWYETRLQSRDAVPAATGQLLSANRSMNGSPTVPEIQTLSHYGSSLVGTQAVRALHSATIVVDVERADGYSLDAVASFAAMVAMAEMDGDPPPPDDSILGLFAHEPDRRELSDQDSALLTAIYEVPPDREAYQHRRQLVTAMTKAAKGE